MVHRLDPRYPLVWRTPSSIQVGVDPARVVLDTVSSPAERMLAALVSGATRPALALVSGGESPDDLLAVLGPVLEKTELEGLHESVQPRVAVVGQGRTAIMIARVLEEHGVLLEDVGDRSPAPDAAVIVAHYAVPPAERGVWLRRDVPHLPVVYSDSGVVIGPLVEPGRGPCLTCVELHHRDRDPAWPAIASQLLDRTSPAEHGVLTAEAATASVRRLLPRLGLEPAGPGTTPAGIALRIDRATGVRTEQLVGRHPQCTCND